MKIHHFLMKNGIFDLRSGKTPDFDRFSGSKNRFFIIFSKFPGSPPGNRKKRDFWSGKTPRKIVIFSEKLWKKGVSDPEDPSKPSFSLILFSFQWKSIEKPCQTQLSAIFLGPSYVFSFLLLLTVKWSTIWTALKRQNAWKCLVKPSSQRSSLALAMCLDGFSLLQRNGRQFERLEAPKGLKFTQNPYKIAQKSVKSIQNAHYACTKPSKSAWLLYILYNMGIIPDFFQP